MNRYFGDAWYHAKQAGTNAYKGLREAGEPIEQRVQEWTGREIEAEPTRTERVKGHIEKRLDQVEDRAELRARKVYEGARRRVRFAR